MTAASDRSLRMLVLGGTGFIGPYHVRAAVERGHQVTVFSRGVRELDASLEVERLVGDRSGDLSAIAGREWDAVLDLATFGPRWVRTLGEALADRVKHYTFISTNATYAERYGVPEADMDEEAEVLEYAGAADPYEVDFDPYVPDAEFGPLAYGRMKILCEREAERQFPGRTLVVRPGYIVGPGDPQGWMSYWLRRLQRGGEILASGGPLMQVQFIDVRDLADWVVRMAEQEEMGTYNAVGTALPMGFAEMLGAIRGAIATPMRITWVRESWLLAREDVATWRRVLFWSAAPEVGYAPGMRIDVGRATSKGLTHRPFTDTVSAALAWEDAAGKFGTGEELVAQPWDEYLEQEQQLLAEWHRVAETENAHSADH